MNGGDPAEAWRRAKANHPAAGEIATAAQRQIKELAQFVERQKLVSIPDGEPVLVAPTPDFYRWSSASMWTPGPFETKPTRAYYYVTDVDRSWAADRQEEHLRDFNYPTLWSISMHEVCPGHFLQYQHLRQVESKVRKSTVLRPRVVHGGLGALLRADDDGSRLRREDQTLKLGQLQEALIRLVRFIVGIRLHAEDLSVEQGVRMFREEAFLEEAERPPRSGTRHIRSDLLVYPLEN